jgi:uncharacterized RDD family membrane protein YckC
MRSFLKAPSSRRLTISVVISLTLVVGLFGFLMLATLGDWRKAADEHQKWLSGQKERCESLIEQAKAEIKAINAGQCSVEAGIQSVGCREAKTNVMAAFFNAAELSECPVSGTKLSLWLARQCPPGARCPGPELEESDADTLSRIDSESLLHAPRPPPPLLEYALSSRGMELPIIPLGIAVLTALLFAISDVGRRIILEPHVGWRRLILVLSVAAAAAAGCWRSWQGYDDWLEYGLVSFIVALLSLIYGRAVFLWVAAGFGRPAPLGWPTPAETSESAGPAAAPAFGRPQPAEIQSVPGAVVFGSVLSTNPAWTAATFWRRFWARCVDLPVCWLAGLVVSSLVWAFLLEIRSLGPFGVLLNTLVGLAFICVAVFFYEAFFVSRFSATFGKMLFGITVSSVEDRHPSWDEAKRRAWSYLKSGLFFLFLFPFLQVFGAFAAWRRREESQPWDTAARTHVRQKPVGKLLFGAAVLVSVLLIVSILAINKTLKEYAIQDIVRSIQR